VLGAGVTDSDKVVDRYVDFVQDIPELGCKELASRIEVSVLQSVVGLIPLDKKDNIFGCWEDADMSKELAGCMAEVERVTKSVELSDIEVTPTKIEVAILGIIVNGVVTPAL
jgi:hypothetical protein